LDIENLFENFVIEVNHNQVIDIGGEQRMQISPVSSGVHIGSSNWTISVKGEDNMARYGVITNICLEGEYRYPKNADPLPFFNVDCLLLSSSVVDELAVRKNLEQTKSIIASQDKSAGKVETMVSYTSQILELIDKLNTLLNSSSNAKVLMPITPQFLLELVDLLLHKISD
jgi:hypothetical protein